MQRKYKLLYHYSTSSTSSIKKIYRLELQRFLAKGCPLASHTITLSPDLKKTASLSLLTGGHRSAGEEKDVQRWRTRRRRARSRTDDKAVLSDLAPARDGLRPQARCRSVCGGRRPRAKPLPADPQVCYLFSNHTLVLLPHLPRRCMWIFFHSTIFPICYPLLCWSRRRKP